MSDEERNEEKAAGELVISLVGEATITQLNHSWESTALQLSLKTGPRPARHGELLTKMAEKGEKVHAHVTLSVSDVSLYEENVALRGRLRDLRRLLRDLQSASSTIRTMVADTGEEE